MQLLCEIFLILGRIQRYIIIIVHTSSCKVPVILASLIIKLEFSGQIFEKYSNTKFHENLSRVNRVFFFSMQTDRQT